ncbi:pirin family protein [Marinomonas posidonica]|uniref:Pirin domain protein n=1 Tax=Marinomonas posidonica (strain CECT 7376 / NCIMB 14433 / IVIA-Po-181) TaxID=491952 RepID=F6CRM7_MARPP|nr:pirin family protein [Marinomonas posidonica]AEF53790.1 Pirin domain protein [Marinomonas posidonica IVIA-Po-181]
MIQLRSANDRGHANFGWLNSYHSFSFGSYFDPQHMGFSHLRVINDDTVRPSAGFETHGHKDMEILSLVLQGTIAHKDSTGNVETLPAGEYQLMSAGTGIYHSEFNASDNETLKFLQIWIQPNRLGGDPGYQQKAFGEAEGLTNIITPNGQDGTLAIKQDMRLHQLIMAEQTQLTWQADAKRHYYIHLIEGELSLATDITMKSGDGAKIQDIKQITFTKLSQSRCKALLFDLA